MGHVLEADGADVRFVPIDITSDDSVTAAVASVSSEVDHLDTLVNNAGITGRQTALLETGPDDFLDHAKALPGWKVNAVDPGYTATDLNANRGHKTIEQGAKGIVAMATVDADGPTGGFFDDKGTVAW